MVKKSGVKVGVKPGSVQGKITRVDQQNAARTPLTKLEKQARREAKNQSIRVAAYYGDMGNAGSMAISQADQNFYSPQLSTDFLELPQSEREKRELLRFWYTCWVPGTPVLMWDGTIKPLEDVKIGDAIPNGFGTRTKVVETFRKDIKDTIVRMKVWGIQCDMYPTGNHPFYTIRAADVNCKTPSIHRPCRHGVMARCHECVGRDLPKPDYVYAKDLRVGDYILSPWLGESVDCGLTRAQLRLLGYYAAGGSLAYRSAGVVRGVEFSLNIDEAESVAVEIVALYDEAYNKRARVYTDSTRNTTKVVCDGLEFADFCSKYVGRGSHTKKLHVDLVHAEPWQMLEFLGAYWNGDGCFTDNSYTADTMSVDLASQVFNMLRRLQIPAYNSKYDRPERTMKDGRVFPPGTVHYVSFPGRYCSVFAEYANHINGTYSVTSTRVYLTSCEYGFLHRIEKLEAVPYEGPVLNIEVDGDGDAKSYVAHGLANHNTHPIIGAAIDFHTDVPMSKIRLSAPKGKDITRNKQILHFYEKMCGRLRLFQTLYDITHEYWLHGNVFIFCEDHDLSGEIPEKLTLDIETLAEELNIFGNKSKIKTNTEDEDEDEDEDEGENANTEEENEKEKNEHLEELKKTRSKAIQKFVEGKYEGWQRLQILPPEQVKLEIFQYTNRVQMELIPSEKDRLAVMKAQEQNDPEAQKIADDIPDQIRDNLLSGQPIPLNTTPYDDFLCSSFCYHLAHKRSPYDDRGVSILERCLRTLLYQDKLRQAQTSIASRAMTPKRIIWGEKMSQPDVDDLRDQIDQALIDPDFTIITNFEVHWDEVGARDRLLDLSTEYEITNKLLFIGLRITESMLTGESTYSGERIHLDVMNTMYLLYRETLADFVEQFLFAPIAEKKGFWEEDEYGNKNLLFPRLQFTRLALRDNTEMQDFMFNLYQKGSMPIDYIYDLLNIDSEDAHIQLQRDMFTPKDSTFNEITRSMYGRIGEDMATRTDAIDKISTNLGLKLSDEDGDRFGKE